MRIQFLGVLLCATMVAIGCSDNSLTAPPLLIGPPDIGITPRTDSDAELAALIMSGELVAPDSLYDRFHNDLKMIRGEFGDSIPSVNIVFGPPWPVGILTAQFEKSFLNDTSSNRFHQFDSLNTWLRLDTIRNTIYDYYEMRFKGRLHPARLIDLYKHVPGIISLRAGVFVGDGPEFYVLSDGDTFRYFFREAWGDCPAGCIFSEFYYVTVTNDEIEFVGSYLSDFQDTIAVPGWFDSVRIAHSRKHDHEELYWHSDR